VAAAAGTFAKLIFSFAVDLGPVWPLLSPALRHKHCNSIRFWGAPLLAIIFLEPRKWTVDAWWWHRPSKLRNRRSAQKPAITPLTAVSK
jgi:hypothetical protein